MSKLDLAVVLVFTALVFFSGLSFSRSGKNMKSFFAAGGALPWWMSGLSLFMSFFSAGTFVVWGSIAYTSGWVAVSIQWTMCIAGLIIGFVIAPRWQKTNALTAAQFISERLGVKTQKVYTYLFLFISLFTTAAFLYPVAKIVEVSTGIPINSSITFLGILILIYTAIGGLWAVIVTDVLQFVVLTAAVLIVVPLSFQKIGGISAFIDKAPDNFFNFVSKEYSFSFLIAFGIYNLFFIAGNWAYVQRYTSVATPKDAKKVGWLFGTLYAISPIIWMLPPMLYRALNPDLTGLADLFALSGAKFAGPVAQHHDGFAMWDSDVNPWNAKDMGPKRDILGDLFVELRKRNLKTIATFHHARNGQRNATNPKLWGRKGYNSHYPFDPNLPTSTTDPKLRKLFGNFEQIDDFNAYWLDQINEVVDAYSPDIIWFDSWLNLIPEAYQLKMIAHHLNNGLKQNKEVVLCHKQNDLPQKISVYDFEQGGRRDVYPIPWMTDITLGQSRWMYVKNHPNKNAALVIRNMIDVWSKNGTVLLNVSPKADGTIPLEQQQILKKIGKWLDIHGEAVYETRPHLVFGYGTAVAKQGSHDGQSSKVPYTANDIRFTISKDRKAMYVFFLGKPEIGKRVQLRTIGGYHRNIPPGKIANVRLLGSEATVKWEHTAESFYITMPKTPMNNMATVFKIELE